MLCTCNFNNANDFELRYNVYLIRSCLKGRMMTLNTCDFPNKGKNHLRGI